MTNNTEIIAETKQWLKDIVIGLNFCPFAKKVFDSGSIHFYVDNSENIEECLAKLIEQCQLLDANSDIETSFILYPLILNDFDDYLDFLELANQLLAAQNYEGVYQLASFHPQYHFENTSVDDAENYTNRSPYPMLHLLREKSLADALKHYKDAEKIPLRNIELAQQKGADFFISYLKSLKQK